MSDSKGAAIDGLDDILYGIAEECGTFNYDISAPKQAILAILAQEVKKARIDELTIIAKLRGSSKNPTHESTLSGDYLRNRLTQLERLG